ncbi:hypothetical protein [Melissospora conviva]|uniref:hypothetical protein n=1 Tax=Melissospora conviva TaxID=3388432 RepID=UPI003C23CFBC
MMVDKHAVADFRSSIRIVSILEATRLAGFMTTPLHALHAIAYFADALAPAWELPVLERQVLKGGGVPTSPDLQRDIDQLVGRAVVLASDIHHLQLCGQWTLEANYQLNPRFSPRIIEAMSRDATLRRELKFVSEVVLALSGLGLPGIPNATQADASYADPNVDEGDLVELDGDRPSKTSRVTTRLQELLGSSSRLNEAEVTHLYIRHLYASLGRTDA